MKQYKSEKRKMKYWIEYKETLQYRGQHTRIKLFILIRFKGKKLDCFLKDDNDFFKNNFRF